MRELLGWGLAEGCWTRLFFKVLWWSGFGMCVSCVGCAVWGNRKIVMLCPSRKNFPCHTAYGYAFQDKLFHN